MALSTTQERLEKSLFDAIRLTLVAEGYLPDISSIANNPAGQLAWQGLVDGVVSAKGFCVELFGVGSSESKFLKRVPRIVIQKRRFLPSTTIGTPGGYSFSLNEGGTAFNKSYNMNSIIDAYYDILLTSNEAKQDRVLNAVLAETIPSLGYMDFHDKVDNQDRYPIELVGQYEESEHKEGVTTYIASYKIPDLSLAEAQVIGQASPILEITTEYISTALLKTHTLIAP
jgi:hypothetical protein